MFGTSIRIPDEIGRERVEIISRELTQSDTDGLEMIFWEDECMGTFFSYLRYRISTDESFGSQGDDVVDTVFLSFI